MNMWMKLGMVGVGLVAGTVLGFIAATAGTGAAMQQMTRDRDELRDRLTVSMQRVMDSAAASLEAERKKSNQLTVELERYRPKAVRNGADDG